jgi:hypothetical protein
MEQNWPDVSNWGSFRLKNGYFDFYTDNEFSFYRSIFYYEDFNSIKAVYRMNESMKLMDRCIMIESPKIMKLWQFRLRSYRGYSCITASENLEIGQLVKTLLYSQKANYLTM